MYSKPILEINGEPVHVIDGSKIEIICERPDEIDYLRSAKKSISFNLKVSDDSIKWMEEQMKEFEKRALAFRKALMRYNRMMTKKHPLRGKEIVEIIKKRR